jgi:hypothetical protein
MRIKGLILRREEAGRWFPLSWPWPSDADAKPVRHGTSVTGLRFIAIYSDRRRASGR